MNFPRAITRVENAADIEAVRELFLEYERFLDFNLHFQGFADELAALPGDYVQPEGCLLLARTASGELAGCAAVRPLEPEVSEMKRLFVRELYRGRGLGRQLAKAAIAAAREIGYSKMRLDTMRRLAASLSLYYSLGFREISPYRMNPHRDVIYLELDLT